MNTRKIILVDDQPTYRNVIKNVLKRAGNVEVIGEASNGSEFLEILDSKTPDIVFMDIEMPVMNGIEATKKAIKKQPDLVIIGLSMYDNKSYIEELINAGAKGYLLKLGDNYNLIRTILEHPKAQMFFSSEIKSDVKVNKSDQKTILIADDFESTRYIVSLSLQNMGHKLLKAENGKDALTYFDGQNIDLLITDYNMPVMNGVELIRNVRQKTDYAKLPIIMLTTEKTDEKKQLVKEAGGVTAWIEKPFQLKKFITIIEKSLR